MVKENEMPDRFAHGTGDVDTDDSAGSEIMPGVVGGGEMRLPGSGREGAEDSGAASAEGTIGAVGEMDITGAPAGAGGSSSRAGESEGGGPGGGSMSRGGGTAPAQSGSDTE
jgi:hypothetical protein